MDELTQRCMTICGEDRTGCFITNTNHLECITDMIINKIWAAREMIELGTRDTTCAHLSGILNIATTEMDELIHWVQEIRSLQIRRLVDGNVQVA